MALPTFWGDSQDVRASSVITSFLFIPFIGRAGLCQGLDESYGTVAVTPGTNDGRPTDTHPDKNLAIRGYEETSAYLGLIDLGGDSDQSAPQLPGLFSDDRTGVFVRAYQVNSWNWLDYPEIGSRGDPITYPPVTLGGLQVSPGEVIGTPSSRYDIGVMPTGYQVMVLYAAPTRITLTYTRDDTAANGYVLHIENICVEPSLVALYQAMDTEGRTRLPALFAGQGIGRALTNELGVAIRDTGTFMDPRSRKDWWQGR